MIRCRILSSFWFTVLQASICHFAFSTESMVKAGDVPWLADVVTIPAEIPEPSRPLKSVLSKEDGTAIATLQEWEPVRATLKKAWLDVLGPLPSAPLPLAFKVLQTEKLSKCTRQLIEYEVEPGRTVEAYLLRPIAQDMHNRPAVVVFHSTTAETIRAVAGLGSKPIQYIGLELAERGFVVLCPANFLWEKSTYQESTEAVQQRHPRSLGMATMLADGMRAVDVLLTLPDVDPHRIGTIGHSLGAKEALYLLAFDDRVQAGVSSEGGLGMDSTNWEAPWYLGPVVKSPDFVRNHHELIALIAPRPFLVLGGETGKGCADGERSWPYLAVGQQVSRLYQQPVRQGLLNHHEGHLLSPQSADKAFAWLQTYVAER